MIHLLWIVPLLLLIAYLSSPRFRGDIAESRVRRLLATGLEGNLYTVFNGLVLPSGGGTVPVDHVVVSKFGIFVIESDYVRGWVSGGEFQPRWRGASLGRTHPFDNPMHRNRLQVEALQRLLDYPGMAFRPIVVLAGHKGFKTPMPDNVVPPERLLAYMRKQARQRLSAEQADSATRAIDQWRLRSPGGLVIRPVTWVRLLLVAVLLAGLWFAFRDDVSQWRQDWRERAERSSAPERFRPDGQPKSERELWEDSLTCAYSVDTGRCACYDPDGARVKLAAERCRDLAERGSVLRQ